MARRRPQVVPLDPPVVDVEQAVVLTGDCDEPLPEREVGTHVEEAVVPFEVRPDGSIAHFAHEAGRAQREMGS